MHLSNHADHLRHDVNLIAGLAAGDLFDSQRIHAETLLSTCNSCADLHRDLLEIASATRSLPAPAAATRDFRLDPEQAERLRRGSWLRAALRPFASTRSVTRPMAAAFSSLGVAGLLVATVLPSLFGSAASPSLNRDGTESGAPGSSAAPVAAPGGLGAAGAPTPAIGDNVTASDAPDSSPGTKYNAGETRTPIVAVAGGSGTDNGAVESGRISDTSPPNLLLLGSFALLATGLILFGLRFAGRRLR